MQTLQTTARHRQPERSGFTLIELLMVILIIATLMALILPAIGRVRSTARNAAVKVEIDQLSTALRQFETRFGTLPPSYLAIPQRGVGGAADWTTSPEFQVSKRRIREIWPRFNFSVNGGMSIDSAGTDQGNPVLELSGAECLVFFLGGRPDTTNGSPLGFSKSPATPFPATGDNRDGPFFKFDYGRLSVPAGQDADGDGISEYLDDLPSQTTPYLFVSAQGSGYRDNLNTTGSFAVDLIHRRTMQVFSGTGRNLIGVYRNGSGVAWNKDSFQIISPGEDGVYGDPIPADNALTTNLNETQYVGNARYGGGSLVTKGEQDNISNFSSSTMGN